MGQNSLLNGVFVLIGLDMAAILRQEVQHFCSPRVRKNSTIKTPCDYGRYVVAIVIILLYCYTGGASLDWYAYLETSTLIIDLFCIQVGSLVLSFSQRCSLIIFLVGF